MLYIQVHSQVIQHAVRRERATVNWFKTHKKQKENKCGYDQLWHSYFVCFIRCAQRVVIVATNSTLIFNRIIWLCFYSIFIILKIQKIEQNRKKPVICKLRIFCIRFYCIETFVVVLELQDILGFITFTHNREVTISLSFISWI